MFFQYLSLLSSIFTYSLVSIVFGSAFSVSSAQAQNPSNEVIQGVTGGNKNSGDCGYIGNKPNYVINLSQQTYSLNVILEAKGGKPSLLILGPGGNDRFCVLGEPNRGKNAKMGGVWAPGKYLIYVGDAKGNKNPFTLRIINK